MKPKRQRLVFITVSVAFLCAATLLTMQAFRENLVFFHSPAELMEQPLDTQAWLRVGGLVVDGSVKRGEDNRIEFNITDGAQEITVLYHGLLPNLFREGQGVIAEGRRRDATHFLATRILTKHDENYMPREIVDSLKKTGHWKEGTGDR